MDAHHVTAFGLVAAVAGIDESSAVLGWLHQSTTALVSAVQRLAPLGQTRASQILWGLKPLVGQVPDMPCGEVECFTPVLEIAAMRHSKLATRLFIS
jgi:urease accessory protein